MYGGAILSTAVGVIYIVVGSFTLCEMYSTIAFAMYKGRDCQVFTKADAKSLSPDFFSVILYIRSITNC